MQVFVSLLLIILSLVGIADAGYISYEESRNIVPPCGSGFDCATVLTSDYAYIGPFPLANLGVVYYSVVFILAILHYLDFNLQKFKLFQHKWLKRVTPFDLLLATTLFGFFFSLYLITLMGLIIQAWCMFCLISAATSSSLFFVAQYYHATYNQQSSFLKRVWYKAANWIYKNLIKPLFFLVNPEIVHETFSAIGSFIGEIGIKRYATRWLFAFKHPILQKQIDGITFPNPVGLSGGYDYEGKLTKILPDVGFGFSILGTITWQPYQGNPKPRYGRFPDSKSILVNKGLKNPGAHAIINHFGAYNFRHPVGVSVASTNKYFANDKEQILDIVQCFVAFESSPMKHSFYEMNISCPNTFGGEPFTTPDRLEILLTTLDKLNISKPVYVKMPIDQSEADTLALLEVINRHNIQGVNIGNLTKDKNNPAVTKPDRLEWQKKKGNLSGRPTFDRSNNLISLTKKHYQDRFTIIGTGGIFTFQDAQEKINRGADLVEMITGMIFEGPTTIGSINLELADQLLDKRT